MSHSIEHLGRSEWTVSLNTIRIRQTRSRHEDTLFAAVSIKVGTNAAISSPVISLGNLNNGTFSVPGCVTPPVYVPTPGTPVKIGITVMNWGNNPNTETIGDIAEAIVSEGADDVLPGSGEILDAMYAVLRDYVFADCDGQVILQVLGYGNVKGFAAIRPHRKRPGPTSTTTPFDGTDNGYDSPHGCGPNSKYDYWGQVTVS